MRALCIALLLVATSRAEAQVQDLGHRFPAGAGLDAGTQPDEGVYAGDRLVAFSSSRIRDRNGNVIPIAGLDLDAYANVFGVAGTKQLGEMYASIAFAVPLVKLSVSSEAPESSVDRLGLGDVFVQPIKLGTRLSRLDVVAAYSFYVPTAQGQRAGVGRPQWSEQVSAGGTVFFDDQRGWRISALASYLHSHKKRGIDITRGDTVLVQGGAGGRVLRVIDVGVAGYALWQVTDDRGADLPPVLAGSRERAFGLGPEVDVSVPALRSRVVARFTWDLDGRARPVGTMFVVGVSVLAFR